MLHNRDLALFDADHDQKLPEALALAKKEFEVRHDIYTWDTLAWVQYKNGNLPEASEASRQALRFGTRDALLLFHAGMIASSLGHTEQARRDLAEALRINPHFHLVRMRAWRRRGCACYNRRQRRMQSWPPMRRNSRGLCLLFLLACLCRVGLAHPMGNFSINHYSRLTLEPDRIELRYIIDLAEIPAYQELQQASLIASPADPAVQHYLAAKGEELGHGLSLIVNGHPVPLQLSARDILFSAWRRRPAHPEDGLHLPGRLPRRARPIPRPDYL